MAYPVFYVAACLMVAILGRGRLMGFWGFLLLGLITHPLVAVLVLLLTAPFQRSSQGGPTHRPLRPGEKRPWFPVSPPEPKPVAPPPAATVSPAEGAPPDAPQRSAE